MAKKNRYLFLHTVQLKSVQRCSRIVCDTPILLLLLFSKKWIFMQHRWCIVNFCICSIFYHFQIHTKKIYTLFWKTYFCPKLHNSILAKKHTLLLEIFEFLRQNWNRFFNFSSKKCQKFAKRRETAKIFFFRAIFQKLKLSLTSKE